MTNENERREEGVVYPDEGNNDVALNNDVAVNEDIAEETVGVDQAVDSEAPVEGVDTVLVNDEGEEMTEFDEVITKGEIVHSGANSEGTGEVVENTPAPVEEKPERTQLDKIKDLIKKYEGVEIEDIDPQDFLDAQVALDIEPDKCSDIATFGDIRTIFFNESKMQEFFDRSIELLKNYKYAGSFDSVERIEEIKNKNEIIIKNITDLHVELDLTGEAFELIKGMAKDIEGIYLTANICSDNVIQKVLNAMVKREFGSTNIKAFTEKHRQISDEMFKEQEAKKKQKLEK